MKPGPLLAVKTFFTHAAIGAVVLMPFSAKGHEVPGPLKIGAIEAACASSGGKVTDGGCSCPTFTAFHHSACMDYAAYCSHQHGPNTALNVKTFTLRTGEKVTHVQCGCAEGYKFFYPPDGGWERCVKDPDYVPPAPQENRPGCGENARYINDECLCNEGYVPGSDGRCISSQEAEQQRRQAELDRQRELADKKRLEENKAKKRKELEQFLAPGQAVKPGPAATREQSAIAARLATYRALSTLERKNPGEAPHLPDPLKVDELGRKIAAEIDRSALKQPLEKFNDFRRQRILQGEQSRAATAAAYLEKFKANGRANEISRELADKSAAPEDKEKSDWQWSLAGMGRLVGFSQDAGLMNEENADKLNAAIDLGTKLSEGDYSGATTIVANSALELYVSGGGHFSDLAERGLKLSKSIASVGEKVAGGLEVVTSVVDGAKKIQQYQDDFGGATGGSATGLMLMGKAAEKLSKFPGVGVVAGAPAVMVERIGQMGREQIQQLDRDQIGMATKGNTSKIERFLRSNAERRDEQIDPGNDKGGTRTTYTVTYETDGETRTETYNDNNVRWVTRQVDGKDTGFIVPLEGLGDTSNKIVGKVQYKVVDNRSWIPFVGCIEMEIWTLDDPPRKLEPPQCVDR